MGENNDNLRLFHTGEHACGYWPDRIARDLVFDPHDDRLPRFYPQALQWGFRRSGDIVYRPHCRGCRACVAVRIPVDLFRPNRSQRRVLARNAGIDMRVLPAARNDERLALYLRYLKARHPRGGMDDHGAHEFEQFLVGSWANTRFLELREHGRLLAVAVTDIDTHSMSAVYTFYDPDEERRSLGRYGILWQIAEARRLGLDALYLGYWIKNCKKMNYKTEYRPIELLINQRWSSLD